MADIERIHEDVDPESTRNDADEETLEALLRAGKVVPIVPPPRAFPRGEKMHGASDAKARDAAHIPHSPPTRIHPEISAEQTQQPWDGTLHDEAVARGEVKELFPEKRRAMREADRERRQSARAEAEWKEEHEKELREFDTIVDQFTCESREHPRWCIVEEQTPVDEVASRAVFCIRPVQGDELVVRRLLHIMCTLYPFGTAPSARVAKTKWHDAGADLS